LPAANTHARLPSPSLPTRSGHQLDAKLSCVAVAAALGLDYVHVPFRSTSTKPGKPTVYWDDAKPLEGFYAFDQLYPVWRSGMRSRSRFPTSPAWWPFNTGNFNSDLNGACSAAHFDQSWFRLVEKGEQTCCKEYVYSSDNCWDYFNCHADWPGIWDRVAPRLRAHYNAVAKPDPLWHTGWPTTFAEAAGQSGPRTNVVLHYRRGDVRFLRLPKEYYANAIRSLRAELPNPRFRIQTDGTPDELQPLLQMLRRGTGERTDPSDVTVDFRAGSSLQHTFHRMVAAHVLVMSRSSLSMAAGLLSNGTVLYPKCYANVRRPLPHWRLLDCPPAVGCEFYRDEQGRFSKKGCDPERPRKERRRSKLAAGRRERASES
tara:strand:- start:149 stop:1267 length:1119 start_codon:yes stop_codon:yes gene_type:complete